MIQHSQTHSAKDAEMSTRKHTQCAHMKRKYFSMCLCHLTLSALQSSLQRNAAVESMAMKSRHDRQIVGAKMKVFSRKRRRGVGGLWWGKERSYLQA